MQGVDKEQIDVLSKQFAWVDYESRKRLVDLWVLQYRINLMLKPEEVEDGDIVCIVPDVVVIDSIVKAQFEQDKLRSVDKKGTNRRITLTQLILALIVLAFSAMPDNEFFKFTYNNESYDK